MSIKKLVKTYEKYIISSEHQFQGVVPAAKVTLTIPGENGMFLRRVSTNFTPGATLQEAEELAFNNAVSKILGDKQTKNLVEKFPIFDLQIVPFNGPKECPFGVKIILIVCGEDGKAYRTVNSLATGADLQVVEAEALTSAVNKALGV